MRPLCREDVFILPSKVPDTRSSRAAAVLIIPHVQNVGNMRMDSGHNLHPPEKIKLCVGKRSC